MCAVPGLFGPIVTTGVALSAAIVVVTNPLTAPNADVAIPAAAVSGAGQAVDMLDENFIKAVAPGQPESTNPFAVLKDLVGALVADAADLGKAAVRHAFAVGASVVSRPELTAASYPYVPTDILPLPEDLRPVVEQAWAQVAADAGNLTDPEALAAALAAGAALGAEPGALFHSLRDVGADVRPALDDAASALAAAPRSEIGDAVRSAVERYLPSVPANDHIAALPKNWNNLGSGLTAPTAEPTEALSRSVRTPAVERVLSAARSGAVERRLNAARTAAPEGSLSGRVRLGAANGDGPHRLLSNATGAIGHAVKTRANRTSD